MDFIYYYKTPDGIRHEAEIGAPSRDEAFAALREKGIRPIKVVAKDPVVERTGVRKRVVFVSVVVAAVVAGIIGWVAATRTSGEGIVEGGVVTNGVAVLRQTQGPLTVAQPLARQPLARQRIPGNRERIEKAPPSLFKHPSEAFLARFAEPGHKVEDFTLTPDVATNFPSALKDAVMVAADELTEYIDLKRIVAGMKREMRAYLAGGGTIEQYVVELVKRQKMELAYREKAENRLNELLAVSSSLGTSSSGPQPLNSSTTQLSAAYAYWLKANASLQSMGIAPLTLPDELRAYQMSLDIDDAEGVPTLEAKPIESAPVAVPEK